MISERPPTMRVGCRRCCAACARSTAPRAPTQQKATLGPSLSSGDGPRAFRGRGGRRLRRAPKRGAQLPTGRRGGCLRGARRGTGAARRRGASTRAADPLGRSVVTGPPRSIASATASPDGHDEESCPHVEDEVVGGRDDGEPHRERRDDREDPDREMCGRISRTMPTRTFQPKWRLGTAAYWSSAPAAAAHGTARLS